jgi:hypothetical protein
MQIKIPCSCGARYSFEIEPVNGVMPYAVNCPQCGVDGTPAANQMIANSLASVPVIEAAPNPVAPSVRRVAAPAFPVASSEPASDETPQCPRHPLFKAVGFCVACHKPICVECMQKFGYVCSINCRYQAEQQGIEIPPCPHQLTTVRKREWQKGMRWVAAVALVLFCFVAFWLWYIFGGYKPSLAYSLKLPKGPAYASRFIAPDRVFAANSQLAVLHDVKGEKRLWSTALAPEKKQEVLGDFFGAPPKLIEARSAEIWIGFDDLAYCLDRASGTVKETVKAPERSELESADENTWIFVRNEGKKRLVTRVNLQTHAVQKSEVPGPGVERYFERHTMDQVTPTASAMLEAELGDAGMFLEKFRSDLLPAPGGQVVMFECELVRKNLVIVQAVKAPSGPSMLNENTSASTSAGRLFEELANEQKRANGGTKTLDQSTYKVTLRSMQGGAARWTGEFIGKPGFFPLTTVDILTGGKRLVVFDKQGKVLGEPKLTFPVADAYLMSGNHATAPAAERQGRLYFFDQGVLTAFELPKLTAAWRIPSVGVYNLCFNGDGDLYVSTTSANPEDIQYSETVKLIDKTSPVIMKVDPKNGKIQWKSEGTGQCYLSGKYVYGVFAQTGGFDLANALKPRTWNEHFRVHRLDPGNGKTLFEFYHHGEPTFTDFDRNQFLMVLGNSVDVMRYFAF